MRFKYNDYLTGLKILLLLLLFISWIYITNIAIVNDYNAYLIDIKYVEDPFYSLGKIDYIFRNIDFIYLLWSEEKGFIQLCYAIILATVLIQLFAFVFVTFDDFKSSTFNDFSINTPPLIGVIGTIYAFTYFLSDVESTEKLLELFKINFTSAALTTILGGISSIFNLFILSINESIQKIKI